MKVIIAGSRGLNPNALDIREAIKQSGLDVQEVVSGTAKGVDQCGEQFAIDNDLDLVKMPANWGLYGNSAGYRRNLKMAEYADALIAFWDGKSKGTDHMINIMLEKHKPVKVVILV